MTTATDTAAPDAPQDAPKSFVAELVEVAKTIGVALLIALVLRTIVFQPNTIPSASMEPTLLTGDYILVTKYDYGWSHHSIPFSPPLFEGRIGMRSPHRGDPVVFRLPRDPGQTWVKRLIGLPGDRIQVMGGQVIVNGKPIPRVALGQVEDPDQPGAMVTRYRETLPDGKSYITFDRGPDSEGDYTAVFVVPQGQYFMMGDNRDNSLDSRWPKAVGVGFVPAENLLGPVRFVLVSWRAGVSLFKPWTWVTDFAPERALRVVR